MICGACKVGGFHLEQAKRAPWPRGRVLLALAAAEHERCQYPDNCPCQHSTRLDIVKGNP